MFLWTTFTLSSNKYAILDRFWAFFENVTPWTASNISKLVFNFKSWQNTSNWIVCWFVDLFMLSKLLKFAYFGVFGAFLTRRTPWKVIFERKAKFVNFQFMLVVVLRGTQASCQTNEHFGRYWHVNSDTMANSRNDVRNMGNARESKNVLSTIPFEDHTISNTMIWNYCIWSENNFTETFTLWTSVG